MSKRHCIFVDTKDEILYLKFLLYVHECLPGCMSVYHVYEVPLEGWKRTSDVLEQELQRVVRHWKSNLGPLQKQQKLLTPESSVQSQDYIV